MLEPNALPAPDEGAPSVSADQGTNLTPAQSEEPQADGPPAETPLVRAAQPQDTDEDEEVLVLEPPPAAQWLRHQQRCVLDDLAAGRSVIEAAYKNNISKTTVYRWMQTDADFRAAVRTVRSEIRRVAKVRLRTMTDRALDGVETALARGDLRACLAILRGQGMLPTSAPPRQIKKNAAPK